MADPLYELLIPYFDRPSARPTPSLKDATTNAYLKRLTTLPLSSLTTTEPQSLTQSTQSLNRTLQSLSKRSHKSIIEASNHLSTLDSTIPTLASSTASLRDTLPKLDEAAIKFSENFNTRAHNEILDRRRKALLLSRNADRLVDVLDLPTLLSSAISSSNVVATSSGTSNATSNYASALDLNAHIRRLHGLYPSSPLINSVERQAELAMKEMATDLIALLRSNSLKLAAGMRTISWLRRVAPELDPAPPSSIYNLITSPSAGSGREGALGSLFLVCRFANLKQMLEALEPLRDLADQETTRLQGKKGHVVEARGKWEGGQQTEKYLKRYIEIFREQSFSIISMYRSIFPPTMHSTATEDALLKSRGVQTDGDLLFPLPSAVTTFPLKLVGMLESVLWQYLPNVRDRSSRDSLLTQVLYCAGSLGRLGGDFSMLLAGLVDDMEDGQSENEDWIEVTRKHRVLAGKLESMVGGKDGIA